jgi:hypothetical protein
MPFHLASKTQLAVLDPACQKKTEVLCEPRTAQVLLSASCLTKESNELTVCVGGGWKDLRITGESLRSVLICLVCLVCFESLELLVLRFWKEMRSTHNSTLSILSADDVDLFAIWPRRCQPCRSRDTRACQLGGTQTSQELDLRIDALESVTCIYLANDSNSSSSSSRAGLLGQDEHDVGESEVLCKLR